MYLVFTGSSTALCFQAPQIIMDGPDMRVSGRIFDFKKPKVKLLTPTSIVIRVADLGGVDPDPTFEKQSRSVSDKNKTYPKFCSKNQISIQKFIHL